MITVYKIMFGFKRARGCDLFADMRRLTKNETSVLSRVSCSNFVVPVFSSYKGTIHHLLKMSHFTLLLYSPPEGHVYVF